MYITVKKVRNTIIMEHIISFLIPDDTVNTPFYVQLTGISYPDPNYVISREQSEIYCLEYIIDGEGTIQVDNKIYHPSKGDVYILPKGRKHHYYSSQHNPWTKIWINVNGSLCDALFHIYRLENVHLVKNCDVYPLFQKFVKLCEQKDSPTDILFQQCSLIFHEILSKIHLHLQQQGAKRNSVAYDIKQYIDQHIAEKLSIQKIAETISLSASQLNRVFKKEFHQTPYDYFLSQKIETAKLLLVHTNLSIKQVAYNLKFADEHYFSNCFKAKVGITPGQFVKQQK